MSRLKLNLDKAVTANKEPSIHAVTMAPTSVLGTVLVAPKGVFHDDIVVTDGDGVPLVKGTDYIFGHVSRHAKVTYDIDAYGSLVLLNPSLTQVNITPNYLGGSYAEYDNTNLPQQVAISGTDLVVPLYWDSKRDYPHASKEDEGLVLPGGSIKTSLHDIADILEMFARIPEAVLDPAHVINLLNLMLPMYQDQIDVSLTTDAKHVREAINEVRALLVNVQNTGPYLDGYKFLGVISSPRDLDTITVTEDSYLIYWPNNPPYTVTFTGSDGNRGALQTENAHLFHRTAVSNRWTHTKARDEEGMLIDRVDARLKSKIQTVEEATREILANVAEMDNPTWHYQGPVTESGSYPTGNPEEPVWWAIAKVDISISGDWDDGDDNKVLQPGEALRFDPVTNKLSRGSVADQSNGYYPALNPALGTVQDIEYHIDALKATSGGADLPGGSIFQAVPGFKNDGKSFALSNAIVESGEDSALMNQLLPEYGGVGGLKANLPKPPRYEKTIQFKMVEAYSDLIVDAIAYDFRTGLIYFIGHENATSLYDVYQYNRVTGVTLKLKHWLNISRGPKQLTVDAVNDRLVWGSPEGKFMAMNITTLEITELGSKADPDVMTIDGKRNIIYWLTSTGVLQSLDLSDGNVDEIASQVTYGNLIINSAGVVYFFKNNAIHWYNPETQTVKSSTTGHFEGGFGMALNPISQGILKATGTEPNAIYYVTNDKATITPYIGGELDFECLTYDENFGDWIGYKPGGLHQVQFVETMGFYIRGF